MAFKSSERAEIMEPSSVCFRPAMIEVHALFAVVAFSQFYI